MAITSLTSVSHHNPKDDETYTLITICANSICEGFTYLEEAVYGLVTDSGLCLLLAYKVLEVFLKALPAPQEPHGHVVISVALAQLREHEPSQHTLWGQLI